MILIIDNYDSFTYNLVQRIGELELKREVVVRRNDKITLDEIDEMSPQHVIISPGPCTPNEAGISVDVVKRFMGRLPILGVCLGHQCIGQALGGTVVRAPRLMHGKTSAIHHDGKGVYYGMTNPFTATRYHSLSIERDTLPKELVVTSWTERDELMGFRHESLPLEGVQFHPESFLTTEGNKLLSNFLSR